MNSSVTFEILPPDHRRTAAGRGGPKTHLNRRVESLEPVRLQHSTNIRSTSPPGRERDVSIQYLEGISRFARSWTFSPGADRTILSLPARPESEKPQSLKDLHSVSRKPMCQGR